mgnify:CR=1 FL=1
MTEISDPMQRYLVISAGATRTEAVYPDAVSARQAAERLAATRGGEWYVALVFGMVRAEARWIPAVDASAVYP